MVTCFMCLKFVAAISVWQSMGEFLHCMRTACKQPTQGLATLREDRLAIFGKFTDQICDGKDQVCQVRQMSSPKSRL